MQNIHPSQRNVFFYVGFKHILSSITLTFPHMDNGLNLSGKLPFLCMKFACNSCKKESLELKWVFWTFWCKNLFQVHHPFKQYFIDKKHLIKVVFRGKISTQTICQCWVCAKFHVCTNGAVHHTVPVAMPLLRVM